MPDMDLETAKESLAQVVDQVQSAEDITAADLSRIIFSTLVDQFGENLAEQVLSILSSDLADFVFQHEVVEAPELTSSDSLDRLIAELEGAAGLNTDGANLSAPSRQETEET